MKKHLTDHTSYPIMDGTSRHGLIVSKLSNTFPQGTTPSRIDKLVTVSDTGYPLGVSFFGYDAGAYYITSSRVTTGHRLGRASSECDDPDRICEGELRKPTGFIKAVTVRSENNGGSGRVPANDIRLVYLMDKVRTRELINSYCESAEIVNEDESTSGKRLGSVSLLLGTKMDNKGETITIRRIG